MNIIQNIWKKINLPQTLDFFKIVCVPLNNILIAAQLNNQILFYIQLLSAFITEATTQKNYLNITMKIVVIGAGVVGLSTAVQIAEHYLKRDVQVTLISEAFSPNTTGDGSAGLWGPYYVGNTSAEKIV